MNKIMLPAGKPLIDGIKPYLDKIKALNNYKVIVLGVRGYFKDSMGEKDKNDIGIYDDAIFVVADGKVTSWNANTDPSKETPGVAHLAVGGPYLFKIGMHNMKAPYEALRQWGNVTVLRDGKPFTDNPHARFYTDIHKGGFGTTSSLGCQTIHPTQWPAFLETVKEALKKADQIIIPYVLCENEAVPKQAPAPPPQITK